MATDRHLDTAAPHPEEMRATVDLTIGNTVRLQASARATPAGLIAAAVLVSAAIWVWTSRSKTPSAHDARR